MTKMLHVLTAALALSIATPAAAQQVDEQLWVNAGAGIKLGDGVKLNLESTARFGDRADGLFHSQFSGLVSYKLSDSVEIGGGYVHTQDYDNGGKEPNEERLRQQLVVKFGGGFSTRLRTEQRFNSLGKDVAVRTRAQLRYNAPIGSGLSVFANHESFINFNDTDWGVRSGYERMRNAAGITVPLSKKISTDIGYLNQYRFGKGGKRDQMDHVASVSLAISL